MSPANREPLTIELMIPEHSRRCATERCFLACGDTSTQAKAHCGGLKDCEMNAESTDQLLTKSEATARLKIAMRTLDRKIENAEIPIIKIGRAVRIQESELHRFISSRKSDIPVPINFSIGNLADAIARIADPGRKAQLLGCTIGQLIRQAQEIGRKCQPAEGIVAFMDAFPKSPDADGDSTSAP